MIKINNNRCPDVCPKRFIIKYFTTAIYQSVILPFNINNFNKFFDEDKIRIEALGKAAASKARKTSMKDLSMKGIPQILLGVERTVIPEGLDQEDECSDSDTITD